MHQPQYKTDRLLLRPTDLSDAPFVLTLLNSPLWLRYIGDRGVRTLTEARAYIRERMLGQLTERGYGNFTVIRSADGVRLGCCGIYHRSEMTLPDLGFSFLGDYIGRGYGYESARRLLRAAHEDFGLTALRAITTPDNEASRRLLEKLGFVDRGLATAPFEGRDQTLQLYTWHRSMGR